MNGINAGGSTDMSATIVLIDGQFSDVFNALNRGTAYGDGLFETIKLRSGELLCEDLHIERLRAGCERLQLPLSLDDLHNDIGMLAAQGYLYGDGVLKILLIRGGEAAGYRRDPVLACHRVLVKTLPRSLPPDTACLRVCDTRASVNPSIAGLKHLNRLDSVLARAEWSTEHYFDGILLDDQDCLVETTAANIFWCKGRELYTPSLDRAGVAGILRHIVIDRLVLRMGLNVHVGRYTRADFERADSAFITSSLIGLVPVSSVPQWQWQGSQNTLLAELKQCLIDEKYI